MPIPDFLHRLAPPDLPTLRRDRFDGAGFGLSLSAFPASDRAHLARIYAGVAAVYDFWLRDRDETPPDDLQRVVAGLDGAGLTAAAEALARGAADPAARKAVHDVRGGGLTLLVGTADLVRSGVSDAGLLRACVGAARDHAKMMRALFPELDPDRYAADEAHRSHRTDGIVSALDGMSVLRDGRPVTVSVRCRYDGAVSARCLEIASLDRVLYNLVNNAVRFAADGRVRVWIFPVGRGLVRWVVQNVVSADQAGWLAAAGPDLGRLFAGGLTRGGTGVGMSNCADVVAAGFGLEDGAAAVAGGYLGARAQAGEFYAWFHWPAYTPSAAPAESAVAAAGRAG